jgi:addiction module RelE/StbE family toxin
MQIKYSKIFLKQITKAPKSVAAIFDERVRLFVSDKDNPILNNHQLKGKFQGCRSINVGGDWRAIFEESSNGDAFFVLFGTHSQLYKK